MSNCVKIGITGGICSGKSKVLSYLKEKGFVVFSCDEINASLWQNEEYLKILQKNFPECVSDGKIDKNTLREVTFSSEEKRKKLEKIAHPHILDKLFKGMNEQISTCFAEVPLLLECNLSDKFDKVLVLMRDLDSRKLAIINRDSCDANVAELKIKSQFPYEDAYKEGYFSNEKFYLIYNDSSLKNLYDQIDDFLVSLK